MAMAMAPFPQSPVPWGVLRGLWFAAALCCFCFFCGCLGVFRGLWVVIVIARPPVTSRDSRGRDAFVLLFWVVVVRYPLSKSETSDRATI